MIKQNFYDWNLAKLTLWNFLTSIGTDDSWLHWAMVIINGTRPHVQFLIVEFVKTCKTLIIWTQNSSCLLCIFQAGCFQAKYLR